MCAARGDRLWDGGGGGDSCSAYVCLERPPERRPDIFHHDLGGKLPSMLVVLPTPNTLNALQSGVLVSIVLVNFFLRSATCEWAIESPGYNT